MGKFLRFVGILLLILVAGFLVLCAVSDKELKVEVSTTINAPKSVVWEQIVMFHNWEHWSPWKEMDTTIVVDYSGTDGQEGAKYHYVGKKSGEGTSINMGVTDGEMKYQMDFIKPFSATADGYYRVVEEGGKTKATWYFHENMNFFMRGMSAIFGAKKMLNKSFNRGLELLKTYCEAHAAEAPMSAGGNMTITEYQYPGHTYAGVRKTVKWADMHQFFGDAYALLGKEAGTRIDGPAAGLYYNWNEEKMEGDIMASFPVKDNAPVKGATVTTVAPSAAFKMDYIGPYSGMGAAHNALMQKLAASGKKLTLRIEEYIKMPPNETDSNKYETNIIYLVN